MQVIIIIITSTSTSTSTSQYSCSTNCHTNCTILPKYNYPCLLLKVIPPPLLNQVQADKEKDQLADRCMRHLCKILSLKHTNTCHTSPCKWRQQTNQCSKFCRYRKYQHRHFHHFHHSHNHNHLLKCQILIRCPLYNLRQICIRKLTLKDLNTIM
ncbi:predicted protein [Lodderomyces elongisporus NRRL YB-4239]|uniref:Uncharacterized protein n=1 Tax=Lodderomyces elongisporus (strain ATCC 11503 / CBS 2605 / JCM 1781 / NBRC 1676 / NRRL YB-4239) TaxID=379508 RepID=A5E6T7_LODEL|nr:predicted protein [Lodderomyces elongisporus NRRL YB-4239]